MAVDLALNTDLTNEYTCTPLAPPIISLSTTETRVVGENSGAAVS